MTLDAMLSELAHRGVQLKLVDSDRLSVSAPRGGVSDDLRERIASHKPALIEWLGRAQRAEAAASEALPIITPDPARWHDPFPLADLQAGFLLGQGEDMEFHVRAHQYMESEHEGLDPARFEASLNTVLHRQRHNLALLTPDNRLQVPREFRPLRIQVQDLRHLSDEEAQATMLRTRAEMARQELPLDRWPTEDVRISLYGRTGARMHVNHNNVLGDGYGTSRVFAMAHEHYSNPRPLPELGLSFRDCVLALEQLEQSPLGQASLRYWMERVPQMPGPPPVPRVAGRNPRVRSRLTHRKMHLSAPLWSRFKRHAHERGITPSNALTAVYAEVIAQWSGSRHFVLNHMVTHRFPMHAEIKQVFGNFGSLYPLEVDWRDAGSFAERAHRVQARILEDMRHLYCSGMKVLQALNQGQKTLGQAPCPFVVASGLFIDGWEEFSHTCLETPQVLLDYQYYQLGDGSLLATWDLFEEFFPPGLVDAMQGGFERLLHTLAEDEAAWAAHSFDLLPAAEREQRALVNRTQQACPDGLLHSGLAASAARFPDKPAVVATDRTLSYAQLNTAANRLAQCLREAGAGSGDLVAIVHDKGWEQAVAAFGILACGAAYVPMDPRWPADRVRTLLEATRARVVVSSRRQPLPWLPAGVSVVYVDEPDLARFADEPLPPAQRSEDLAYVIFTSGSTGQPKGVMIDHRGALNTVLDINQRFGVGAGDVLFGISSLYFDLSVYDLFGAAATGATLVLPAASDEPDPAGWTAAIERHGVTVWNSVPALVQLLIDVAGACGTTLPTLKTVMMSGDWIPVPLPDQIRAVAPAAHLWSLGGATEASIWSIHHPIGQVDPAWPSIPYGKPLANQTWHVLGENGEDAPTWVAGHLHIGGVGLAMGYWADEDKTNAAFVRHPRTGERLYRTGDLGRWLPDGSIEFLGRADFQVKIQGYRVELGEIEAVLSKHPGVCAAVVMASATQAGKQLVAFVVAHEDAAPDVEALQAHLRSKLPGYMVPAHIVALAHLPLTATGKVDRKALAKLCPGVDTGREFVAPRDAVEKELAAIWEEVLGTSPIGVKDDFFDLGGQSFAAVRMMTRIAQQFGQRLPISALIERRSVEALARGLQLREAWSPLVQLCTQGEGTPAFFVHPAGGSVMCYRGLSEKLGRPFYGLQAPGLSGEQPPLEHIEEMAALYLQAIRQVRPHGPYLLGGWSSGGMVAFEIARRLEALGEDIECVVMVDAPAPMQDAPIDEATLLRWFAEDMGLGDVDAAQWQHVLAVFGCIVRAGRCYRPSPIAADIRVLRAAEGRVSEFADHPEAGAADWGWRRFTRGRVTAATAPGTHHTVLHDKHLDALVEALKEGADASR